MDDSVFRPRSSARVCASLIAIAAAIVTANGVLAEPGVTEASAADVRTRAAMHELFGALRVLLPAAVSGELGDEAERDRQAAALATLRDHGQMLGTHGSPLPSGSRLLATALGEDAARAEAFFARERFDSAAWLVTRIVDDCTGCHSRQASADAPITAGFVDAGTLEGLDRIERAEIAAATRQFERALDLYETAFDDADTSPEALLGPITRYLVVAIRVARDPERAAPTLGRLARREGLAPAFARDLSHWFRALQATSRSELDGTTLAAATSTVERAEGLSRYPADRRPLVDYLVASTQLNDLAAQPQDDPDSAAAIYELLGRAEAGISQNIWQTRADLYWETAIRLAPRSPAAKRAFAALEREVRAGYTGSSGIHLPADEAARIERLRALVERPAPNVYDGATLFAQHCALCHGAEATGRGPLASELMWNPADLTTIAARGDGTFPRERVFELIARRDPLGSHQSPEMPRWGKYWTDDSKIDALVTYLESIQVD